LPFISPVEVLMLGSDEGILRTLKASGALKEGHFLLSSGRHSAQYIEKFDLLRNPKATSEACAMIAARVRDQAIDVVAGPTTGGIILAFELGRQLGAEAAYAERVSDAGSGREFRRGTSFRPGSRVLVVDDIMTTGGSVRETLDALASHAVDVVGVALLVDRSGGKANLGVPLVALATLDIACHWSSPGRLQWAEFTRLAYARNPAPPASICVERGEGNARE
jgi:orotate phosphoribosyltransferase